MQELAQLEKILSEAISINNDSRKEAERIIYHTSETKPEFFYHGLIHLLRRSQNDQVRSLCAIFLKNNLVRGETTLFERLSEPLQGKIKEELLKCLSEEKVRPVRAQICNVIAEISPMTLPKGEWDDLLPFLQNCCTTSNESIRSSAIYIFGQLCENVIPYMIECLPELAQVFGAGLKDSSLDVRIVTVSALSICLSTLDELQQNNFKHLIDPMLKVLEDTLNTGDEMKQSNVLTKLVDIATQEAEYFREHLDDVVRAMCTVGMSERLEDDVRQLSLECLVSAAEGAPGLVRKSEQFVVNSLTLAMHFMLCVDDDANWGASTEEYDSTEDSNFECGEDGMDRLAQAIGANKTLPVVEPGIMEFLKSTQWKHRYAGLMSITQVGEVMDLNRISEVVRIVLNFFHDPHPRVRYAAIHCIGQLSTDFGPEIQNEFHKEIMPILMHCLKTQGHPRVQAHAGAALINFTEHCTPKILSIYLNDTLAVMYEALKQGVRIIQEQVITAVASIADSCSEMFLPYYSTFAPALLQMLQSSSGKNDDLFRGRVLECLTFIGMAVGRDEFRNVGGKIMELTAGSVDAGAGSKDPSYTYTLQAWCRLCSVFKEEFVPYLVHVMPAVLRSAALEVRLAELEDDEEASISATIGGKRYGINHTLMEEKSIACSMLVQFSLDLGRLFFPYMEATVKVMVPLLEFWHDDEVRNSAITCLTAVVNCVIEAAHHKDVPPDFAKQLFAHVCNEMAAGFLVEPDMHLLMVHVSCLRKCLSADKQLSLQYFSSRNEKGQCYLETLTESLFKLIRASGRRVAQRERRRNHVDFDDETEEILDGENLYEGELNFQISECLGTLISISKDAFAPLAQNYMQELLAMLNPEHKDSTSAKRKIACFIFDPLLAHLGQTLAPIYDQVIPLILRSCKDDDPETRQAALFDIGVFAQHSGRDFQPFGEAIACQCFQTHKEDYPPEDAEICHRLHDNATSILVKVCEYQCKFMDVSQIFKFVLQVLPIKVDTEEGVRIYTFLCTICEQSNEIFVGENYKNLPRIVQLLVESLNFEWIDEKIRLKIQNICNGIRNIPNEQLKQAIMNQLSPADQAKFKA